MILTPPCPKDEKKSTCVYLLGVLLILTLLVGNVGVSSRAYIYEV